MVPSVANPAVLRIQNLSESKSISTSRIFLAIVALTFAVRLVLFFLLKRADTMYRSEIEGIALSLMREGVFGNPFSIPTGPTAHAAPVYPWIMALIYRAFGSGMVGEWAQEALRTACTATALGLLPLASRTLLHSRLPGTIAGVLGAISYAYFGIETGLGKEAPLAALLFLAATWLWGQVLVERRWNWKQASLVGFSWGLLLLMYPGLLLPGMGFALATCFLLPGRFRFLCTVAAIIIVWVTPWTVRNHRTFGSLFFIRDNFGLEFDLGNSDAPADFSTHPFVNAMEAQRVIALTEVGYSRARFQHAVQWIRQHPAQFAGRTTRRILAFWLPYPEKFHRAAVKAVTALLALLTLPLLWKAYPAAAAIFSIVWIAYPIPYYFVLYSERYRYPIEWSLYLCAGLAIASRINAWRVGAERGAAALVTGVANTASYPATTAAMVGQSISSPSA